MKIVFLGYAVSSEEMNCLSGASVAGNKMQLNILKQLHMYSDLDIHTITVYPIAPFPKDKAFFVREEKIVIDERIEAVRIGFCNLPIVKQIWQIVKVYFAAAKIIDTDTIILTFNSFPQVGIPAMLLKKKNKCKVVSILADLPVFEKKQSQKSIYDFFRGTFIKITEDIIRKCDALIVLNENTITEYSLKSPYIVIEGGINESELKEPILQKKERKNIVYAGALTDYSGILNLIEAMKYVYNPDAVLEIYGEGPLKQNIIELSKCSEKVRYCGKRDNAEILEIQRQAFLLVNPRMTEDPISKVTFPSKLFEYMTSGTPVLATKINGLTDGFLEHLFTTSDSPYEMANMINEILNTDSNCLEKKALDAYKFIKREKNWTNQVKKIYEFMGELK